jgi:hypothetical protein
MMRAYGVRSLAVSCWQCHHETVLSVPIGTVAWGHRPRGRPKPK